MNFRQLGYGLLSFVPGVPSALYVGTGGTSSAEYCYGIWLRHLALANANGMQGVPRVVAELGPGDSIGVGIAALLSGSERYLALDALPHANAGQNLRVFDSLLDMFQARRDLPGKNMFPELWLEPESLRFPEDVITEDRLGLALAPDRIAWLRRAIAGEFVDDSPIEYQPSWDPAGEESSPRVDFLIANAVMEHVADLPTAYTAMWHLLMPGGLASHVIDFRSHGLFKAWDGHWACPKWLWRLFMGRRSYLLNREPLSTHRRLAAARGFEECVLTRLEKRPEAKALSRQFRAMAMEDRATASAYMLLAKPLDTIG